MYAQIRAGIAGEECPGDDEYADEAVFPQEQQEECKSGGIGGMARRESVTAAAVAIHHFHHRRYRIFGIGGTEPFDKRAYNGRSYLIRKCDGQSDGYQTSQHDFPVIVFQQYVEYRGIERHPYPFSAVGIHELVGPCVFPSIDGKQCVRVKLGERCQKFDHQFFVLIPAKR